MTISLKHSIPADGTFSAQGATAWDDEHVLTQSTGTVLGRSTAGTGATEEISLGTNLTLSGGTLDAAPAGASGEIQFNNSGVFGGSADYTFTSAFGQNETYLYGDAASAGNQAWIRSTAVQAGDQAVYELYTSSSTATLSETKIGLVSSNTNGPYLYFEYDSATNGGVLNIYVPTNVDFNYSLTLPDSAGTAGQALITDGTGVLSWNTFADSSFKTIAVAGQSNVVADSATDTLTLVAGSNITITTNAATDEITIAATGGGGGGISLAEVRRVASLRI